MKIEDREKLQEFSELEGSELGEYVLRLLDIDTAYFSPVFAMSVDEELHRSLVWFKENFTIVERIEVPEPYTSYHLEPKC